MATIFVSPGISIREQVFTTFTSRIGTTKLGVVGEFQKGPAFEAIKLKNAEDNSYRFGTTHHDFPATYVSEAFLTQSSELYVTRILGKTGFQNTPAWLIVAGSGSTLSGTTLAVIRSKKGPTGTILFDQQSDVQLGAIVSPLSSFVISGSTGPLSGANYITVSLDETKTDYLAKSIGKNAKTNAGTPDIYVESIFPHFIREAVARGQIVDIQSTLVYQTGLSYTNYESEYTNAVTPWVVSRVIGSDVKNLFRVHTRSDGDSSNREIKISIANIDLNNKLFDVIVRRFDSNDSNTFGVLERFQRVSLNEDDPRFVARVIGCVGDEPYERKSNYIEIEMANIWPSDTVPGGFRGYQVRGTANYPNIYYKTVYETGDTVNKTFLGVSELGYSSLTSAQVSVRNAVSNVEYDLFQYQGAETTGMTQLRGFHMENTANALEFVSGNKSSMTGYTNTAGALDRNKLKFTVVPAGGFDGWDKYKKYDNYYEKFAEGMVDNIQSFKDGIDLFASAESVDINVLTVPGADYKNNEEVVKYALEMVENRADMFYIMDSPRLTVGSVKGTPEEAVEYLELTGIDTSYAATYWPWIQIEDINTQRLTYIPPTAEAARVFAYTDNRYQAWFAPAGALRATLGPNVKRTDVKLSRAKMDTLYAGRINPIQSSTQNGMSIWGQKTLQVAQNPMDRINTRRLFLRVERLVAAASYNLIFDQNDQATRDQFLSRVEPILLQIQNQRGISAFRVVMDDSNNTIDDLDTNTLNGKIQIKPIGALEFLNLTFQLLPTGARFEEF